MSSYFFEEVHETSQLVCKPLDFQKLQTDEHCLRQNASTVCRILCIKAAFNRRSSSGVVVVAYSKVSMLWEAIPLVRTAFSSAESVQAFQYAVPTSKCSHNEDKNGMPVHEAAHPTFPPYGSARKMGAKAVGHNCEARSRRIFVSWSR